MLQNYEFNTTEFNVFGSRQKQKMTTIRTLSIVEAESENGRKNVTFRKTF